MSRDEMLLEEGEDPSEEEDEMEEINTEQCYGEYGRNPLCPDCPYAEKCKKFKDAEKTLVRKNKGKYSSRGKDKGKDRF